VFVVEGGKAVMKEISIGHRSPIEAEVTEGLDEGAAVILHPSNRIEDGVRVSG
jgi:HlyD family secretion protein